MDGRGNAWDMGRLCGLTEDCWAMERRIDRWVGFGYAVELNRPASQLLCGDKHRGYTYMRCYEMILVYISIANIGNIGTCQQISIDSIVLRTNTALHSPENSPRLDTLDPDANMRTRSQEQSQPWQHWKE